MKENNKYISTRQEEIQSLRKEIITFDLAIRKLEKSREELLDKLDVLLGQELMRSVMEEDDE